MGQLIDTKQLRAKYKLSQKDLAEKIGIPQGRINDSERVVVNIPNWGNGLFFINVYGDSMYPKFTRP